MPKNYLSRQGRNDAINMAEMTEAQVLKLYKMSVQRKQFIEHLLRHVAAVTYQYNCFEMSPEVLRFAQVSELDGLASLNASCLICPR